MKDFKFLTSSYPIGNIKNIERINEGVLNDNYLLETDKGKYFVKGIRSKVSERLAYIYSVEKFMASSGIPAIIMLTTTDGEISVNHEGVNYTVYPFIESDRKHKYTNNDYVKMGKLLGAIHSTTYKKDINSALTERKLWGRNDNEKLEKLKTYKKQIGEKSEQADLDEEFLEYVNKKLALAESWQKVIDLPNDTLIHGDYHAGNLLIDKDTREIVGLCDWEKAEYAPRVYELVRAIMYIAFDSDVYDIDNSLSIAKSFVEGYKEILATSKEELEYALRMRLTRHIFTSWIEDKWYGEGDDRANHFIKNEMRILADFVEGDGINKILSLF